jgi:hypothetical protein
MKNGRRVGGRGVREANGQAAIPKEASTMTPANGVGSVICPSLP